MYITIHTELTREYNLSPVEFLVFSTVLHFHCNNRECYLSQQRIAEHFNISTKTVTRAVKSLSEKELIDINTYEKSKSGVCIISIKNPDAVLDKLSEGIGQNVVGGTTNCHRGCDKMSDYNNNYNNNYNNIYIYGAKRKKESGKRKGKENDYDEFFELSLARSRKKMGLPVK